MRPSAAGYDHATIAAYLRGCFELKKDDLLLKAAADTTQRWNLTFVLDFEESLRRQFGFGGTVNYNKKRRCFDFIEYSGKRNFAVRISIVSGCYCDYWAHRDFLYRNVPEYYHPEKKLAEWLKTR